MGILKRIQNGEEVNLWDPFCGSGTIMLEIISRIYSGSFREKQDFSFWPGFPDKEYDLFLE
jgi:23S rRNA G2445 N2-methylase RlmL